MTPRHSAPRRARGIRHARRVRRHPVARGAALAVVAVLSFGVTGAATAYSALQGNIDSAEVEHLLGDDRPEPVEVTPDPDDPNVGAPVTILVMGSDSRVGTESSVNDGVEGQRSDTTLVAHISADRQRVDVVSIPRDSLVDIPECFRSDGTTSGADENAMFNSAFSIGGESGEVSDAAACTQRTVEQNTGVRIDHFVVVDMAGFVTMVDALGGIEICIPQEIISPNANNLHLYPGNQVLDGTTALSYARARTGVGLGNGSDTDRIGRQQGLLAATTRGVLSKNVLTDVDELFRFLSAVTSSLTISSGLSSLPDMAGLASSLQRLPSGNITFMTIPFAAAPSDPNRVVWTDEADAVWANMAADLPLTGAPVPTPPVVDPGGEGEPAATTPAGTTAPVAPVEPVEAPEPGVDPFTPDDVPTTCG